MTQRSVVVKLWQLVYLEFGQTKLSSPGARLNLIVGAQTRLGQEQGRTFQLTMRVDKLQTPAQAHLAKQEVDACFLHCEGALFLVVPHGFTHVQCPLLPALYHATLSH